MCSPAVESGGGKRLQSIMWRDDTPAISCVVILLCLTLIRQLERNPVPNFLFLGMDGLDSERKRVTLIMYNLYSI